MKVIVKLSTGKKIELTKAEYEELCNAGYVKYYDTKNNLHIQKIAMFDINNPTIYDSVSCL